MKENSKKNNLDIFKKGMADGIPIMLGYFAVSFALGIAAAEINMTSPQAFLMSAGMMASAGEFAAISLISSNSGIFEIIMTCIIVNLRYLLMSCSLSQKPAPNTPNIHRFGLAYCITDEIFALSFSVDGYLNPFYTYGMMLVSFSGWTVGTVCGVIFGNILPVWLVNALGVSLYGMFLAIIIPPAKKDKFTGILVAVSMLMSFIFTKTPYLCNISTGFRIIILTVLIAGIAAFIRPSETMEEAE